MPYSRTMQGAYLVQLGKESCDELMGRVEEIDSGRAARFQSGAELLRFLKISADQHAQEDQAEQKKN